ncbi:glycosyltransferase [Vibrio cyclitrophicus]|uniref:glycosyltransferase n=1 Tax=Vibrio cyclitrophicus TaxID=47951 RepID=UPI00399AB48C
MKIAYVINSFGVGGAEKQIVSLAKEHHKRGNVVLIIRLKSQPDELLSQVDFCEVRFLNMSDIFGLASCLFRYKNILDEFNPDVVHSHLPHSIVFSRFLKLLTRKKYKLVCTAHNYNIRTKLFGFLYKHTDYISDFNTNVSQSAVDRYIRKGIFSPEKSSYIPNGFYIRSNRDLSIYQREKILNEIGLHESNYVCCAVGRLDAQKNYPMMLEAFKYVVERD